jgi:hypothetical protein
MTWIKGTTTWGDLATDLTKLICGEKADGVGTTVPAGTCWIRDVTRTVTDAVLNSTTTLTSATAAFTAEDVGAWVIAAGIPNTTSIASVTNATTVVLSKAATATASGVSAQICLDTIRTPTAKNVSTGACANRTGYFSALGIPSVSAPMSVPGTSVCRVTNPFTSEPALNSNHRWYVIVTVGTANTVAGNYSNASLQIGIYTPDSGTSSTLGGGAPNAAGVLTSSNGLQITVSDPSGFLTVGAQWVRGFNSTYMYGIDTWPMLYRSAGPTSFGTPPPGVAGTDYDIVILAPIGGITDRGQLFCGLGIKTATANTGALYTVTEAMALIKCRIFNSTTVGMLALDLGNSRTDAAVPGNIRVVNGIRTQGWCRPFQTPASVTAASAVQYFASVTSDGIVLVLNGDPASSGKLSTAFVAALTPVEPVYDVLPVVSTFYTMDYTGDQSSDSYSFMAMFQHSYWSLRRRQDGSEGSRDWQTKWMRGEGWSYSGTSGQCATDTTSFAQVQAGYQNSYPMVVNVLGGQNMAQPTVFPARQNKPAPDGRWWLYGFTYGEGDWTAAPQQVTGYEYRLVRGAMSTRFFYIPGDGWGSGDELTDTGTGTKYLLVMADYVGIGSRFRMSTNTYQGGLAVAEL